MVAERGVELEYLGSVWGGWLVGSLVRWFVGWLVGWLVAWLVGR